MWRITNLICGIIVFLRWEFITAAVRVIIIVTFQSVTVAGAVDSSEYRIESRNGFNRVYVSPWLQHSKLLVEDWSTFLVLRLFLKQSIALKVFSNRGTR